MMAQRNRRDQSGPHTPKKCDGAFYIHYTSVQRVCDDIIHARFDFWRWDGMWELSRERERHNSKPQHKKQNEIKVNYINRSLENLNFPILSGTKLDMQI